VTDRLLLDTHIALWLDSGDDRLRPSTRSLIDGCWRNGGTVFLSAVTAWEIALLVDAGRIDLDIPVEAWIERFLGRHRGGGAGPSGRLPQLSSASSGTSRPGGPAPHCDGDRA